LEVPWKLSVPVPVLTIKPAPLPPSPFTPPEKIVVADPVTVRTLLESVTGPLNVRFPFTVKVWLAASVSAMPIFCGLGELLVTAPARLSPLPDSVKEPALESNVIEPSVLMPVSLLLEMLLVPLKTMLEPSVGSTFQLAESDQLALLVLLPDQVGFTVPMAVP